ncbi:MAG: hypothetical protein WBA63_11605 [Thermomicrobiales bacterium]
MGEVANGQSGAQQSMGTGSPAQSASVSIPELPKPQGGAGSHELAIDSNDPDVLRQHLARARERLTFYESFDRIIGENIRRSGELMLETIALREEAQERERVTAQREAERDAVRAAEQERYRALFSGLIAEADRAQAELTALRSRLADALSSITGGAPETASETDLQPDFAAPETLAEAEPSSVMDTTVPATAASGEQSRPESEAPIPAPETGADAPDAMRDEPAGDGAPRTLDILVQGVPRAAVALSLQRYLITLAYISAVETREFAEGILRLTVTTTNHTGLADADLRAWPDGGTLVRRGETANVLELTLEE